MTVNFTLEVIPQFTDSEICNIRNKIKQKHPCLHRYLNSFKIKSNLLSDFFEIKDGSLSLKKQTDRISKIASITMPINEDFDGMVSYTYQEMLLTLESVIAVDELKTLSVEESYAYLFHYSKDQRDEILDLEPQIKQILLSKIEEETTDLVDLHLGWGVDSGIITEEDVYSVNDHRSYFPKAKEKEFTSIIENISKKNREKGIALKNISENPFVYHQLVKTEDKKLIFKNLYERIAIYKNCRQEGIASLADFDAEDLVECLQTMSPLQFFELLNDYSNKLEEVLGKDLARIVRQNIFDSVKLQEINSNISDKIIQETDLPLFVKCLIMGKRSGFIDQATFEKLRKKSQCEAVNQTTSDIVNKYKNTKFDVNLAKKIDEICQNLPQIFICSEYSDFDTIMLNVDNSNEKTRTRYQIALKDAVKKLLPKMAEEIEKSPDSGKKEKLRSSLRAVFDNAHKLEKPILDQMEIGLMDAIDQGECSDQDADEIWKILVGPKRVRLNWVEVINWENSTFNKQTFSI